jgi:4-hydroxybenzoate polyprenyltransferase
MLWVAGFDVLYACQDVEFDRRHGLHSLPARCGPARAMWIARGLHAVALAAFVAFGGLAGLGAIWYVGVAVCAGLVVWQHRILAPQDLSRIQAAFFTANGTIALLLFAVGCVDIYLLPTRT